MRNHGPGTAEPEVCVEARPGVGGDSNGGRSMNCLWTTVETMIRQRIMEDARAAGVPFRLFSASIDLESRVRKFQATRCEGCGHRFEPGAFTGWLKQHWGLSRLDNGLRERRSDS